MIPIFVAFGFHGILIFVAFDFHAILTVLYKKIRFLAPGFAFPRIQDLA